MGTERKTPFRLKATEETAAFLRELHPQLKRKIKAALKEIISYPDTGKSLRLDLKGLRSFRVGRFRIVYRIASNRIIELIAVGPRKTIYQETYRIIRKEQHSK